MTGHIITLITDFGQADGYAGAMKGIILGICPQATVVDISHEIRPQAVRQAAYVLSTIAPYFPAGAVHLAVVDPGVGSDRRPVAVQSGRAIYVAPDNGVLSLALAIDPPQAAVRLQASRPIGATFHGRDLFAPAAARLACGVALRDMGEPISSTELVTLPGSSPQRQPGGAWLGQVLHIDRFGNVISDIPMPRPPDGQSTGRGSRVAVLIGGERIAGVLYTYSDVAPGELVAYVGSSGHLEIAVRDGSAAARLQIKVGDALRLEGLP